MIKFKKTFFVLMILFATQSVVSGQIIENYGLRLHKTNQSNWFQSSEIVQVTLDIQSFPLSGFQIRVPGSATVFLDEILWFYAIEDTIFNISSASLRDNFNMTLKGKVDLTVLKKGITTEDVSIIKGFFDEGILSATMAGPTNTGIAKREMSNFYDFFYLAVIFILFLIAIYKLIFPLLLTSIISPGSVFSTEDFSETNSFQKFFSIDVIFYILIVSMLVILMGMAITKELDFGHLGSYVSGNLNQLFLNWLMGTTFLILIMVVKFIVLKFMAFIFGLGKYEFSHFFYLLRIISILIFGILLITIFFELNDPNKLSIAIYYGMICFFWAYIAGVFMLMFILMNRVGFKKYHLFAYICTAELVPFLIIAKMIIG